MCCSDDGFGIQKSWKRSQQSLWLRLWLAACLCNPWGQESPIKILTRVSLNYNYQRLIASLDAVVDERNNLYSSISRILRRPGLFTLFRKFVQFVEFIRWGFEVSISYKWMDIFEIRDSFSIRPSFVKVRVIYDCEFWGKFFRYLD